MTTQKKKHSRTIEAERLYLELLERGLVRESEEVATILLAKSAIIAEERTREVPSQKKAYKGKEFGFDSPLDMVIYFITELPLDWEKCKSQTKVWQQAISERAKNLVLPTIDKIDDLIGYVRDNLQVLSNEDNTAKARRKQMKPRAVLVSDGGSLEFAVFESNSATAKTLGVSNGTVKGMAKSAYAFKDKATGADTGQKAITMPVKVLEPTNSEEERKAQLEAHGLTAKTKEEVRQELAERNERFCEKRGITYKPL